MITQKKLVDIDELASKLREFLSRRGNRLGHLTSIDGRQLIALVLDTNNGTAQFWESPLQKSSYPSLTPELPQCHWLERTIWDMFGLYPVGHPRLKHNLLHEPYPHDLLPLNPESKFDQPANHRQYQPMEVTGEGIYEIPVGPIHAGIIEPGHFRFSCLGEVIFNLEIRLGYLHRGVEKRLCEIPWRNQRFVAEAAASDSAAANALANSIALESLCDLQISNRAEHLRAISLEIERTSMHIADLGGLAGDIGFLAVSSTMSRLRGSALRLGEMLTGSRFQRAFICPGGVAGDPSANLAQIRNDAAKLKSDLSPALDFFQNNQVARDRMEGIGRISPRLAADFSLVGVAGRASNVDYDARHYFQHGVYRQARLPRNVENAGDVYARAKVRIAELLNSLELIQNFIEGIPQGSLRVPLPEKLNRSQIGAAVVEAFRGELIHIIVTNDQGQVIRYAIKDPSLNNWTGLAIATRNNLVSDFPLCNKSFSLSYGGHDL